MAALTFPLEILTPTGRYFEGNVYFLNVRSEDFNLGILPSHSPLISTLAISMMRIQFDNFEFSYAISGGVIKVSKDKVVVLVNSIEREDEIDEERAKAALQRAKDRIENKSPDAAIDEARARKAYLRAVNRLNILLNKKN